MKPMRSPEHDWANYEFPPSFVLGFHGCDAEIGEAILRGEIPHLAPSQNDYDWLGSGIYFWEGNPARALQFAAERAGGARGSKGKILRPFSVGAIINLKRCLDLANSSAIDQVRNSYFTLKHMADRNSLPMPVNAEDLKARRLDCLVFNSLHETREEKQLPSYDTVRGLFFEGSEIYPNAGVREANHIQICVRNPACILGYFRPIVPILP